MIPPTAYWAEVNWTALGTFLTAALAAASPFLLAWMNGRQKRSDAQLAAGETAQARVDRINREQYEAVRADRDDLRKRLQEEEGAHERTGRDRDDGWDAGRGMEDEARFHRHEHVALVMRFNTLLTLFGQLARGEMSRERATAFLPEIKPAAEPRPVPLLGDVRRKRP